MLTNFEVGRTLMQLTELAQVAAFALAVEAELLKQRERTPYVTFQDIYGVLDIPAVRQSSDNAKRIQQIATDCGWVQTRRRVGTSSERVRAFFPDHVDKSTSG